MAEKSIIGKYEILEKLKEGGMSTVYKAVHPTLERTVILKRLALTSSHTLTERFKREAKIMINLRSDNIVPVFDHFKDGHSYFLVMEYVDGISLEDLLKKYRKIKPEAALAIVYQISLGLKYAHDKGIIHRDIKPDNILISKEGEVKIVDFGIATALEGNESDLTKTGAVMGTPAYMSPEQLTDSKNVDRQTDIYSLGVALYQMLTGTKPFASNFAAETIQSIRKGRYKKPSKLNPAIPAYCRRLVKKMMHCRKRKRIRDLGETADELSRKLKLEKTGRSIYEYLSSYLSASDSKCPVDLLKSQSRKRSLTIAALVLTIIAGGILALVKSGLYYKFLLGSKKAPLSVTAEISEAIGYIPDIWRAELFPVLEEDDNPEGKILAARANGENFKKKIWDLDAGLYSIKALVNDVTYINVSYFHPYVMLDVYPNSGDIAIPRLPGSLPQWKVSARDAFSEKPINDALITVKTPKGWKTLEEGIIFEPGNKYELHFEHPSYFEHHLYFDYKYGKLYADIGLIPRSGTLKLNSNVNGLDILIDNEKSGYLGSKIKTLKKYGTTSDEGKVYTISAGEHEITISNKTVRESLKINIEADKRHIANINYDAKTKTLTIRNGT